MFQEKDSWCGMACLSLAYRLSGWGSPTQRSFARLYENDREPDEEQLLAAIASHPLSAKYGVLAKTWESRKKADSLEWLRSRQYSTLLCVSDWQHWVVVLGRSPNPSEPGFLVADPYPTPRNLRLGGLLRLSEDRLWRVWREDKQVVYGIGLHNEQAKLQDSPPADKREEESLLGVVPGG